MRRKASITVVARHELLPTDRRLAGSTRTTVAAGDHSRNDYVATRPLTGALAGRHNVARDFVPESKWKRSTRGYTVESEADIGMADAAAGNLDYHLAGPRLKSEKFVPLQTSSRSSQTVPVTAARGQQTGNPPPQDRRSLRRSGRCYHTVRQPRTL